MKKRTETLDVNIKVPGNQYDLFTETRDGWFRVYLRESMTPETGERKIVEVGKARVAEYTADCADFYLGGGKYASPNSEPDCYTGEPLDPEDFLRAAATAHVLDMTEDWEWPRGVRRSAREAAESRLAEELRNQADWIVHVHAENKRHEEAVRAEGIAGGFDFGSRYRITVDVENNAETWWDNGGRSLWMVYTCGRKNETAFCAWGETAATFVRHAAEIPGFFTGPGHAPLPFVFNEIDDED